MSATNHRPEIRAVLDELLLYLPEVRAGWMFGHPGYYAGKRLFACVWEQGICLKVPDHLLEEVLDRPEAEPFAPMGRPSRSWVYLVHTDPDRYWDELPLLEVSLRSVLDAPERLRSRHPKRGSTT